MTSIRLQGFDNPIDNCEEKIREFCEGANRDFTYEKYDLVEVPQDGVLRESEIRLANKMVARMSYTVIQSILEKSSSINQSLSRIPNTVNLVDVPEGLPWSRLAALFEAIMGPGVREARATKILHKKRPNLIPILDSVAQDYAWKKVLKPKNEACGNPSDASRMVKYCEVLKADLQSNQREFDHIQESLSARSIRLTRVRLLDILVWSKMVKESG